jgi:CRP/FNR family transcriptional regulator
MQRLDFLSAVPLFQNLTDLELVAMSQSGLEQWFFAGQFLINEFDTAETLFLVWEGQVKLTKTSYSGREQTVQVYGPGELVGLFSLFTGLPFPAAARAMTKCRVLSFSRMRLEKAAQRIPSLMINLFYALAMRQNECILTVESLALEETPQRLASYLLGESQKSSSGFEITLSYSQRELAKILSTTPETLSRVLSRFSQERLITQDGRKICILDRQGLEHITEAF